MINVKEFVNYLKEINIDFFCGVPDSQLSSFCDFSCAIYGSYNLVPFLSRLNFCVWPLCGHVSFLHSEF